MSDSDSELQFPAPYKDEVGQPSSPSNYVNPAHAEDNVCGGDREIRRDSVAGVDIPQQHPQTGIAEDSTNRPESKLCDDSQNPELRHLESCLLDFISCKMALGSLLDLGSEAFDTSLETIAEALDTLVARGFVKFADGHVFPSELLPAKGDAVWALAQEEAIRKDNAELSELPLQDQFGLLDSADLEMFERHADFDPGVTEPSPDPINAPQGWELITDATGKKTWRAVGKPDTKLQQPSV